MEDMVPVLQIRKLRLDTVKPSTQSNVATKWLNTGDRFNWSDSKFLLACSIIYTVLPLKKVFDYSTP